LVGLPFGSVSDTRRMSEHVSAPNYKRHRFPPMIIGHAVWLYFRFARSYRDVEELLAERGVILTYESVRQWCRQCGQAYANELRRRRSQPGDKWHLDEVFMQINGRQHYLWRAVDQDGNVLDILVQARRDKHAATKFLRKLLKRTHLCAARGDHGQARQLRGGHVRSPPERRAPPTQGAEQPRRERASAHTRARAPDAAIQDPGHAQRFLAAYGPIAGHVRPRRHRLSAPDYRQIRDQRFATWRVVTGTPAMA